MFIGDKLRQQRKLIGLSQEKLAEKAGVSLKTIQRWENSEQVPNVLKMRKLADALNTSISYLTEDNDEMQDKKEASSEINGQLEDNNNKYSGRLVIKQEIYTLIYLKRLMDMMF